MPLAPVRKAPYYLLWAIILLKLLLQLSLVNPAYDLHRDEYLHLDQADHLAAGYLSVPPLTACFSLLVRILGNGIFWVKFIPALIGVLTMVVVWRIIDELKGGWFAQVLAALLFMCSAMSRINMLYQPNSMDVLCWTLVFYLLIRYIHYRKAGSLLWIGVVTGLAFLNKYNILFLVAGLIPAVLLSPQKKLFRNRYLYIAVGIAFIIALPNLIWQFRNGLPVLYHMKELAATQLVNVNRTGFLVDQLLYFMTGSVVVISALVALMCYPPFRPYRLVAWAYLFVILLFLYLQAKSYYALGLYPVLLAFGSVYWESLLQHGWRRHLRIVLALLVVAPFLALFTAIFPVLPPGELPQRIAKYPFLLYWEDGKKHTMPQDFADMLGWQEMADLTVQAYMQVPARYRPQTLIVCDNYGQAGAVNYYSRGKLPPVVTFNADYLFWFPHMDTIRYLIIVGEEPDETARRYTSGFVKTGQVNNPLAREYGTGVYLMHGVAPSLPAGLQQLQQARKRELRAWP